jgi:DNA-binding NtrC family response regulator
MAHLRVSEPGRVTFDVDLESACTLGRDADNVLVMVDRHVSRKHLRIARGGDGWVATDLASRHGTFLNGARITEAPLRDGDRLHAGRVVLIFREAASPDIDAVFSETTMAPRALHGAAEARPLQLLFDVSRAIGALADPVELAGSMLDGALEVLGCSRGLVQVGAGRGATRLVRGARPEELVLGQKLLDALLARRESAIVRGGGGQPPGLGAPLLAGAEAVGFIYVTRFEPFVEAELDYLMALAHLTAAAVSQAGERRRLSRAVEAWRDERPAIEMVGEDEAMQRLRARIEKYAPSSAAVLIRGESGTGKELVARLLHQQSPRADQPFVSVNCAAIPDSLIESELFGHEKGAFTGAIKRRRGKFELADRGTLFLDEVGDLSLAAQAKVLRALEEREIHPVGAEEAIAIDVRVVSATHKPLEADMADGGFRSDLFYRLGVAELTVPPLRERGDDIVRLARWYLERAARRLGRSVEGFADDVEETLRRYDWPGNVRQLANEIERALLLSEGPRVDLEDLRLRTAAGEGVRSPTMAAVERAAIERALEESGGSVTRAAGLLGMSRATLYRRLALYKLEPE